jgi:MarR-like DNA-binding transcriptional regulator SgrR of sgrS sRNA
MDEIDYEEVAEILECSPRNARRIISHSNVNPLRRGYRTVRFKRGHILALKKALDARRNRTLIIKIGSAR